MIRRRRPPAIRLFAVLFLAQAALALVAGLADIAGFRDYLAVSIPGIAFDRDLAIVILSARFTIALIPVALVWFLASRFARWMVAVLAVGKLLNLPEAWALLADGLWLSPLWLASLLLGLCGAALLFTPGAGAWFTRRERRNAPLSL